jgi:hypothetical protein
LLLDGFDEMAARSDQETLIDCFGQIFLLAETNAKVIVSCRSNFFRSHADVIKLLRTFDIEIDTGGETADIASLGNLPLGRHGRVLTIAPLSTEQIAEYVRAHFPDHADAITEQMEKVHDLTDLARRPVLLDMILSTLPALRDDDIRLNSANLYEIYTNRWARRDSWRVKLPLEARQILCEGLAWLMLARDKAHFTFAELRETLAVVLEDIVRNAEIFPDVVNDIQTCSFLVRAGRGDTYAMAHKSFSEFFAGRTIAKLLSRRQASEPALRTHRAGGSPRADPYADLLYADDATLAVPNTAGRPASAGVGAGPHRDVAVRVALAWRLDIEPLLVHDGLVSTHSTLRLDWDPSIESFLEDRIMRVFGAPLHETRALPFELSPEIATFALEWLSLNEVRVADLIDVAERADRLGMLTEVMRLGTAAEFWEANTDTLMEALSDPDPDHEAFVAAIACAVTQTSRVRTVDALREIAALVSEEALAVAMLTMAQGAPAKRMIVRAYAKAHSSDLVAILGIYAARDLLSPSQYVLRLFRAAKEMRGSRAGNDLSREITRVCTPAPSVLVGAAVEVAAQGELDDAIWDDVVRAIKLSATIEEADRVKRLWMSTSEPVAVRKLQRLERHLRGAAASRRGSPARSDIGRPRTNERVWRALAKTR